jgi:hypothetical protein
MFLGAAMHPLLSGVQGSASKANNRPSRHDLGSERITSSSWRVLDAEEW